MMVRINRHSFKSMVTWLLWLTGLALIFYYSPGDYQRLQVPDCEYVVDFLGQGHELLTVRGAAKSDDNVRLGTHLEANSNNFGWKRPPEGFQGKSLWLRNLDDGVTRQLSLPGITTILGVRCCAGADRICIEDYSDAANPPEPPTVNVRMINGRDGSVLTHSWPADRYIPSWWSISEWGNTFLYRQFPGPPIHCVDVDTAKQLAAFDNLSSDGVLSPDGQLIAVRSGDSIQVYNLRDGKQFANLTRAESMAAPLTFSGDGTMLLDDEGSVWQMKTGKTHTVSETETDFRIRHTACQELFDTTMRTRIFGPRSTKAPKLVFANLDWARELVPRDGTLSAVKLIGPEGRLFRFEMGWEPLTTRLFREWMEKLHIQSPTPLGTGAPHREWLLVDGQSERIIDRGSDHLLAVSADGHFVVTGDEAGSAVKFHELPFRRCAKTIAIAAAAWTVIFLALRRLLRRTTAAHAHAPA